MGHSAGDELLTTIAGRLRDTVCPADILARLGGDEFAVLIEDSDGRDAGAFAQHLLQRIRQPVRLASRDVHCTASIGVATGNSRDITAEELLRNADLAMYAAKRQGRNAYALFEPAMYASVIGEAQRRLEIEHALAHEQFVVHYQPVVDLRTRQLIGVEALVRWRHPARGLLGPQEFIDNTEVSGLIIPLGRWVLQQACQQLSRWQQSRGEHTFTMNVNLSARQFQYPGLVSDVRQAIEQAGIDAHCLTLELTESILLDDVDAAIETLQTLRQLGVRLAIDDFGTGYSSLNYLKRLQVDILKIDRTFISYVATDADDKALVEAVVNMARALRLRTVAEGIETDDQREMLRLLGCDHGQGFLFGRPAGPTPSPRCSTPRPRHIRPAPPEPPAVLASTRLVRAVAAGAAERRRATAADVRQDRVDRRLAVRPSLLAAPPLIGRDITSNRRPDEADGPCISIARRLGVSPASLLRAAGVPVAADQPARLRVITAVAAASREMPLSAASRRSSR
ncbi:putative bifunctional diguanylate cyclase/phosphodiesterase [Actinoplanes cyaneus]|uniref:putative bifunctional diguanylate cyclase/phosphodiesterase n=1 Tax=Actinoplanes cyaneus TaxID=52696 RepID=UPI001EF2BB59